MTMITARALAIAGAVAAVAAAAAAAAASPVVTEGHEEPAATAPVDISPAPWWGISNRDRLGLPTQAGVVKQPQRRAVIIAAGVAALASACTVFFLLLHCSYLLRIQRSSGVSPRTLAEGGSRASSAAGDEEGEGAAAAATPRTTVGACDPPGPPLLSEGMNVSAAAGVQVGILAEIVQRGGGLPPEDLDEVADMLKTLKTLLSLVGSKSCMISGFEKGLQEDIEELSRMEQSLASGTLWSPVMLQMHADIQTDKERLKGWKDELIVLQQHLGDSTRQAQKLIKRICSTSGCSTPERRHSSALPPRSRSSESRTSRIGRSSSSSTSRSRSTSVDTYGPTSGESRRGRSPRRDKADVSQQQKEMDDLQRMLKVTITLQQMQLGSGQGEAQSKETQGGPDTLRPWLQSHGQQQHPGHQQQQQQQRGRGGAATGPRSGDAPRGGVAGRRGGGGNGRLGRRSWQRRGSSSSSNGRGGKGSPLKTPLGHITEESDEDSGTT